VRWPAGAQQSLLKADAGFIDKGTKAGGINAVVPPATAQHGVSLALDRLPQAGVTPRLWTLAQFGVLLRRSLQSAWAPWIDQLVDSAPTPAYCEACMPFMNQIATLPLVSFQRMSL
jgi:hypothetical protein